MRTPQDQLLNRDLNRGVQGRGDRHHRKPPTNRTVFGPEVAEVWVWPSCGRLIVPEGDTGKVLLARTMDERCEILKIIGAKVFASLGQYEGEAFLKAWEEKTYGEIGSLVQTQYEDE